MTLNPLLEDNPGKEILLLGNEAFARGAIESGVKVATGYPGTPSSEIIESIGTAAEKAGIYAEWSTNEKVAFEVAYAGAVSGLRSLVVFKSVGLNVASDTLMVANAAGIEGGFVIITADDPFGHSSQNEQDCRYFAKMAEIPIIEPCDPQEAKDSMLMAFELSEKSKLPVIIRSVTRLSHVRGSVTLGEIKKITKQPEINENFVYTGFPCIEHHQLLHEKLESTFEFANENSLNKLETKIQADTGILTSGVGYAYAKEMIDYLEIQNKVNILKIGMTNPLPIAKINDFLKKHKQVLILEDGFPYLEEQIRFLIYELNVKPSILGKLTGHLPREGELTPDIVGRFLGEILEIKYEQIPKLVVEAFENAPEAPPRRPSLCAGCPHMAMWYAMKQAVKGGKKDIRKGAVVCGDIGCYGLGLFYPYNMYNTHICMGASIGMACGISKTNIEKPVFAYLGESTFFHSAMSALQNAVFNNAKFVTIVQDNYSTAMTGHQVNPSVGQNLMGEPAYQAKVEDIAVGMGINYVKVVDPYKIDTVVDVIKNAMKTEGPSIIIGRRACAELAKRKVKRSGFSIVPPDIDINKCKGCKICIDQLRCPALIWDKNSEKVSINKFLCAGCGVCGQVCPEEAISGGKGVNYEQ